MYTLEMILVIAGLLNIASNILLTTQAQPSPGETAAFNACYDPYFLASQSPSQDDHCNGLAQLNACFSDLLASKS
jgi:hypothetical protein